MTEIDSFCAGRRGRARWEWLEKRGFALTGGAGFIIVETGPHTYIADSAAAGAKENMVRGGGPEDTLKKRRNAKAARRIQRKKRGVKAARKIQRKKRGVKAARRIH